MSLDTVLACAQEMPSLGESIDTALHALRTREVDGGVLRVAGLPVGHLPNTPEAPDQSVDKGVESELSLLRAAVQLGEPVGYLPEHGGDIVQNLVPVAADFRRQTSTSSAVRLGWHTETAFHPHLPRFLLLICLRGDDSASTTYSCVDDMVDHLRPETLAVLREERFRTGVDESFTDGFPSEPSAPHPVLGRIDGSWTLRWDEYLTEGIDAGAQRALAELGEAVNAAAQSVVLSAGDLLAIDNHRAVHGRSPFSARFDGSDRWLQRAFVVEDLAPSAAERDGRVIATQFARVHSAA
jgi:hypothetical protein